MGSKVLRGLTRPSCRLARFVGHPDVERGRRLIGRRGRVALQHLVNRVDLVPGDRPDEIARHAGIMVQGDAGVPRGPHRQLGGRRLRPESIHHPGPSGAHSGVYQGDGASERTDPATVKVQETAPRMPAILEDDARSTWLGEGSASPDATKAVLKTMEGVNWQAAPEPKAPRPSKR